MLCQQNLICPHKYKVMTRQKYAVSAKKFDKSAKELIQQKYAVSGRRSMYVVDRRSRYEYRTSRFNKYCCDSKFSTLIITLSLTLTLMWACLLEIITAKWAWPDRWAWPMGHVTAIDQSEFVSWNEQFHTTTIAQLCRTISSQVRHASTIGKKIVKQQYSSLI